MIITSEASKHLIMPELAMSWEERFEEINKRKRTKYQELVEQCRARFWKTVYEPIKVGCRGFVGRLLCKVLTQLGITGGEKKRTVKSTSKAAEKATRWLWLRKADPWVAAGTLITPDWVAWARMYVVRLETPYDPRSQQ